MRKNPSSMRRVAASHRRAAPARIGAILVSLLVTCLAFLVGLQPALGWITVDGGENVTLHGNTNVGPWDAIEKYDLNVYGDVKVGRVESIDPFATAPSLNVQAGGSGGVTGCPPGEGGEAGE